ncbi:Acetylornithine/succinyldiaminopimelate aminotransferase [Emticicia aquatica]|uniref:Acetylornithine/succinyldiaminopimelate aminotransferase n=1 Tax=Emticicia aquatica TaxID=1681835 RepID=A0ABM9AT02_9BACT|nr:aminotransferase class III-fold pyridoxal phosphate-dependent enzyme [Emticicia aquatica]CAH0996833.1 Acetylornithine/succinyldiaminopimelate aminotransferase [Emticicia aquatica]
MTEPTYQQLQISEPLAEQIAIDFFEIKGKAKALPGEIDFNFKITSTNKSYILKISRPEAALEYLTFQDELLKHLEQNSPIFKYPKSFRNINGNGIFNYIDAFGNTRKIRLLEWIDGNLYSAINPKSNNLRYSLGLQCGQITHCLLGFNHTLAHRTFDWDLANALWVEQYLGLFSEKELKIVSFFIEKFKNIQPQYQNLRKSTIHNDANDNNIIVSNHLQNPVVEAIIDYGDSVYSQIINDLSVVLAYGIMDFEDPLEASKAIITGYHESFPLLDQELQVLYTTTAMRLVISVTKSAINKKKEPENKYLLISEKSAWLLLEQWMNISENYAYYSFRKACGMTPCKTYDEFINYTQNTIWSIEDLIPESINKTIVPLDLSIASTFIGNFSNYINSAALDDKISRKVKDENVLFVGGYGEARPIYTTDAFKIKTNEGYEHRTIHIGVDFWISANTPIHALENGEVFSCHNNDHPKDYGPTLILKHHINDLVFYTLYGHLTKESLVDKFAGKPIKKGEKIANIGIDSENGGWSPHLHFQIILDMLGHENDFIGVSTPNNWPIFSSICPDPNLLFKTPLLAAKKRTDHLEQINYRKQHLGKSLSLSYDQPLKIVRGEMQYLIDEFGQKYLDTVNNVAHVGHEHPKVVEAGQQQMSILNTNTRYLNDEILQFAEELLNTFPAELSVLHFVNSGSEANELAMRMAKAVTGEKDIIALEIGYHGNTQGCIDISSYKFDGKGGKGCPENTHIVPLPDAFRGIYQGENTGVKYAKHVDEAIQKIQSKNRNVAAFIAESIVSCGGQIDLPEGYLKDAYQFVRKAGGVCIADEVQVGFGRVGKAFWGFQLHGVVPDIVTMGKPIGNGHPLAAVVCTRAVADAFANGMEYFNTFGGNPVSCAIGRQVLQVIKEDKLQENALDVGEYLKNQLKELQIVHPIIADVRGEGLFLGIELVDENKKPLPEQTNYLANRMKDFKILMSVDGPQHNVLKIKPPMCFSKENVDYMLEVLSKVLRESFMEF